MTSGGFSKHLAALSPYFNIYHQPAVPANHQVIGAVYLFRHGILEVSHHDYGAFIKPFLEKLEKLQKSGNPFVRGQLGFLATYRSWITDAHVGIVSKTGLQQTTDLGKAFRVRYKQWLTPKQTRPTIPLVKVWTDSAQRCALSASTFANAFSGEVDQQSGNPDDGLRKVDVQTVMLHAEVKNRSCNNLCWHLSFPDIDQTAGHEQMEELMTVTTEEASNRFRDDWLAQPTLTKNDVYSMQMLHCYDIVSGRASPWEGLFTPEDWAGFEYLRDVKYHYSEGYGAKHTGLYAVPWLISATKSLENLPKSPEDLSLGFAFTHREEVLYLCCLLGLGCDGVSDPDLTKVNEGRHWRVATLAPYLGHVGLETYVDKAVGERLRIIVNGDVMHAFSGDLEQDEDGGYLMAHVKSWISKREAEWNHLEGGNLNFLNL